MWIRFVRRYKKKYWKDIWIIEVKENFYFVVKFFLWFFLKVAGKKNIGINSNLNSMHVSIQENKISFSILVYSWSVFFFFFLTLTEVPFEKKRNIFRGWKKKFRLCNMIDTRKIIPRQNFVKFFDLHNWKAGEFVEEKQKSKNIFHGT